MTRTITTCRHGTVVDVDMKFDYVISDGVMRVTASASTCPICTAEAVFLLPRSGLSASNDGALIQRSCGHLTRVDPMVVRPDQIDGEGCIKEPCDQCKVAKAD